MKKIYRKGGLLLLLLTMFGAPALGQQPVSITEGRDAPPAPAELFEWHEVFTYEVRYSFFKLGEVRVELIADTLWQGRPSWHLRTVIRSNPGIPFMGKEENHYNSILRPAADSFRVYNYWLDNVDEQEFKTSEYIFDHRRQLVYAYEKGKAPDTLALEAPATSGQSVFYMNRPAAGTDSVLKIPIYLNQEKKYLTLTNTTETEMREYDAFPQEVRTYRTRGMTDVNGPFGFSGSFEAWYLADELRVPVEAHVKVWLGNVKIRLIDYKKERREP